MSERLPSLQRVDLTSASLLSDYLTATTAVCPFVEPADRSSSLYACEITPDCQTPDDIHPRLFEQLIPIIERFRDDRRARPDRQQRLLICHMVLIHLSPHLDAEAVRLLNWPNWLSWLLKQLYTPKEIVFGIIRKNVAEKSLQGRTVPIAPFHAVVIRSRVVGSDHRFFPGNKPMLQAMMEADDDGQNAHAAALADAPDIRDPQAMRDANHFQRMQKWGQDLLSKPTS